MTIIMNKGQEPEIYMYKNQCENKRLKVGYQIGFYFLIRHSAPTSASNRRASFKRRISYLSMRRHGSEAVLGTSCLKWPRRLSR